MPPQRDSERTPPPSQRRDNVQCFIGFVILNLLLLILYVLTTRQAWLYHPGSGILTTLFTGIVVLGLIRECRKLTQAEAQPALADFVGVVGGALVTYVISVDLELGAVTASGLVGLLGALILPQQAVPVYCGSFVGMTSALLLAGYPDVLLAGGIAGGVYVLTTGILPGFGGKLGTIAFTGTVSTGLILQRRFIFTEIPEPPLSWAVVVCATAAAVLTYWLSVDRGHGPVIGSSVVGLLGGLLLPPWLPETGATLAVVAICASFTGMSSSSRIPDYLWMTLAGFITSIIFVFSMPILGGAGGKLGTIALGASMGTWALHQLLENVLPLSSSTAPRKS